MKSQPQLGYFIGSVAVHWEKMTKPDQHVWYVITDGELFYIINLIVNNFFKYKNKIGSKNHILKYFLRLFLIP